MKEISLQKDYLSGETIETIYFGGGTPSVFSGDEINKILHTIEQTQTVASNAEITLEANPDDLNAEKIKQLRQTAINRFSIGIQSFFEEDLLWMNRAHNAKEAKVSIQRVQDAGFENITCDLIYGYPLLSDKKWVSNIQTLVDFGVPHISSYSMTVEPSTALASFISKGKQIPMNEDQSAGQFELLIDKLSENDFIHYEISNFAKEGWISKHNSNYWKGKKYLGIGPSAHSFNGNNRQWNIANNNMYLDAIARQIIPAEVEELTFTQRLNEYTMTSLRTIWGLDLVKVSTDFGREYADSLLVSSQPFIEREWIKSNGNILTLTQNGKLYADHIAAQLFAEELH
ncbi:oxygen-independent coproporphyrinogen-3 oxidase [Solitalea koreensis]|uniref:Heme chaperone HemW n=2 Tax=Solitalea koreensis TaxID=543615 RepID=A0A521AUJ2_9SPHI|nr:oxygen-independent coproporphyrinogen-3 oxidase [Solitalea koreensis]